MEKGLEDSNDFITSGSDEGGFCESIIELTSSDVLSEVQREIGVVCCNVESESVGHSKVEIETLPL